MCRPVVSDMNRMFFGDKYFELYFELILSKWNVVITVTNHEHDVQWSEVFQAGTETCSILVITRMYVSQQQIRFTLLRIDM